MRQHILELLHKAHLGIEKNEARAQATVIGQEYLETLRCKEFQEYKESFIAHPMPNTPWANIGSDIHEYSGKLFVVAIAYFSKFVAFSEITDKTTETVILFLKQLFACHGLPIETIAENNLFCSKKKQKKKTFCSQYNCILTTSSPCCTQSNSMSEFTVRVMKRILKKYNDPYISLLEYLNTPLT